MVSNQNTVINRQLTKLLIRVTSVVVLGGLYRCIILLNRDLRLAATGSVVIVNDNAAWTIVGTHVDNGIVVCLKLGCGCIALTEADEDGKEDD